MQGRQMVHRRDGKNKKDAVCEEKTLAFLQNTLFSGPQFTSGVRSEGHRWNVCVNFHEQEQVKTDTNHKQPDKQGNEDEQIAQMKKKINVWRRGVQSNHILSFMMPTPNLPWGTEGYAVTPPGGGAGA
eukprot:Hpha_TRINITY_DN12378_c0_g1::TRINITY_DN12378_c0_g1_i1::g.156114::m.156114